MVRLEPERIHRLHRFGFPVRNDVRIEFIQPEMAADVHVEIVLIPFIPEEGVRL